MPFIAAKSLMFLRNTPARTTSSKLLPAAFKTADRFWKMRSVSATMPPSTTLPVAGSWPTCPLQKRKPSTWIAWENGPTGGASSGEVIAVLLIASPVATSVADQSPQTPFDRHFRCCDESTAAVSRLLACLLYGRYSLGSGAVADSACTRMPVIRHPPAPLIA